MVGACKQVGKVRTAAVDIEGISDLVPGIGVDDDRLLAGRRGDCCEIDDGHRLAEILAPRPVGDGRDQSRLSLGCPAAVAREQPFCEQAECCEHVSREGAFARQDLPCVSATDSREPSQDRLARLGQLLFFANTRI